MIIRTTAALAVSTLLAGAAQAAPQAAPAQAFGGPSVPGLCLLSQEAVFANAKVGQAATARLRQLAQGLQDELAPERTTLENEAKAIEAQRASLKPAELQQRRQALAQRVQAFQAEMNERERRIEATRNAALQRISQEEQPVVAAAYAQHGCGVLFAHTGVLAGGQGMDLTPAVVQGLDAKITSFTFDLAPAPAPASQAPAQ